MLYLKTSSHYRVKHKRFKMLQLLYQFLMTKLCRTFLKLCTLWTDLKKKRIVLQLKMYSFGPYTGAKTRCPSIDYAINCTLLKAVPNKQQFLNVVNSWLVHGRLDKAVN